MTEISVFENGNKSYIPSSWDELSNKDIQTIFMLYDKVLKSELSFVDLNIELLFYFLKSKPNITSILRQDNTVSENINYLIKNCLSFLFKVSKDIPIPVLTYNLVRAPFPEGIKVKGKTLISCSDGLLNLTYSEFRHLGTSLNNFFKTSNLDDLDEAIACIFRVASNKANKAGRYIKAFDNSDFSNDVKLVSHIPSWKKNLLMYWMANCLSFLQTGIIEIDGEKIELNLLFTSDTVEEAKHPFTWNDLLLSIAKEGVLGNKNEVDNEPLTAILQIMWSNYKSMKKDEKR